MTDRSKLRDRLLHDIQVFYITKKTGALITRTHDRYGKIFEGQLYVFLDRDCREKKPQIKLEGCRLLGDVMQTSGPVELIVDGKNSRLFLHLHLLGVGVRRRVGGELLRGLEGPQDTSRKARAAAAAVNTAALKTATAARHAKQAVPLPPRRTPDAPQSKLKDAIINSAQNSAPQQKGLAPSRTSDTGLSAPVSAPVPAPVSVPAAAAAAPVTMVAQAPAPVTDIAPPTVTAPAPVTDIAPPTVTAPAPVTDIAPPTVTAPAPVTDIAPPTVTAPAPVTDIAAPPPPPPADAIAAGPPPPPSPSPPPPPPPSSPPLFSPADFEVLDTIGCGAFSWVLRARCRSDQRLYAIKVVNKRVLERRGLVRSALAERTALRAVRGHAYIVHMHCAFQTEANLHLVLELCEGGTLTSLLRSYTQLQEHEARFYASQLALAVAHIHAKGFLFRDLKLDNVLLDGKGHVRLADFGLAVAPAGYEEGEGGGDEEEGEGEEGGLGPVRCARSNTYCGTEGYMAPEVHARATYGQAADWWSFGCCVMLLLCGTAFGRPVLSRLHHKRAHLQLPGSMSPVAQDLLSRLLKKRPDKRLGFGGASEVLSHPFFAQVDWAAMRRGRVSTPLEVYSAFDESEEEEAAATMKEGVRSAERQSGSDPQESSGTQPPQSLLDLGPSEFAGVTTQKPKNVKLCQLDGFDYFPRPLRGAHASRGGGADNKLLGKTL